MSKCWQIDLNFKNHTECLKTHHFEIHNRKSFWGEGSGEGKPPIHTPPLSAPTEPRFLRLRRSTSATSAPRSMVPQCWIEIDAHETGYSLTPESKKNNDYRLKQKSIIQSLKAVWWVSNTVAIYSNIIFANHNHSLNMCCIDFDSRKSRRQADFLTLHWVPLLPSSYLAPAKLRWTGITREILDRYPLPCIGLWLWCLAEGCLQNQICSTLCMGPYGFTYLCKNNKLEKNTHFEAWFSCCLAIQSQNKMFTD